MIRLTLIDNYYYTDQARTMNYYVYYKLTEVAYSTILDCQIQQADTIIEHVVDNYHAMMQYNSGERKPLLIVEEAEEDTLAEAIVLLKQVARKAKLTPIQESKLVEMVCGWAGQGSYQQDPTLPQGYEGRTVVAYPYSPIYTLGLEHHRLRDTLHTLHGVEVCGIPLVLVEQRRPSTRTHTSSLGVSAEEASRALARLQAAMAMDASYQQVAGLMGDVTRQAYYTDDDRQYTGSHAEGCYSVATGGRSHAEGHSTAGEVEILTDITSKPVRVEYSTDTTVERDSVIGTDTTVEEAHTTTQQEDTTTAHTATHDVLYNRSSVLPHRIGSR